MTLLELKSAIETNKYVPQFLILVCNENNFVAHQYINTIAKQQRLTVTSIEDLSEIDSTQEDIFGIAQLSDELKVLYTENFDSVDSSLLDSTNLIIVTGPKTLKNADTVSVFKDHIIEIPKLREEDISDYICSRCEGITPDKLLQLQKLYNSDIYRLDFEISKVSIFDQMEQEELFLEFAKSGVFGGNNKVTVFDLSNAIVRRDLSAIFDVYSKLIIDKDLTMGLIATLSKNFRDILTVTLNPSCNVSDPRFIGATDAETKKLQKQFYAIKNIQTPYSIKQIVKIYLFLCSLDKEIKTGEFDVSDSVAIDYIITRILST